MPSWSSLECSPACHAGDRGFKSRRGRLSKDMARYANRQSGQAQTLVICGFDSRLCHLKHASAGHRRAQLPVKQPARKAMQVQLLPVALTTWPVRLSAIGCQPLKLVRRVQFPHGLLDDQVVELVDTRRSERRAARRGSSTLPVVTDTLQAGRCPTGPIRPVCPVRYRGLQLRVGQCSAGPHKPDRRVQPPDPPLDRVRKLA